MRRYRRRCSAASGAAGATIIDTKGIISPGLIDTHNHILFDIFDGDDWLPMQVYQDHDQWPSEARYMAMLDVKQCLVDDSQGKPAWCAQTPYGTAAGSLRCEIDKYGELKGLIAGTTSIVGLPGTSAACFGSLARSIDVAQNELASDEVQTSALFPPSDPSTVCANFTAGKTAAYLVHAGEGTDAKALGEFAQLGTLTTPPDCLYAPQTAITHATAFTATEFATMGAAGMKLILVAAVERVAVRHDHRHSRGARGEHHGRARARLVDGRQPEPARRAALRRRVGQHDVERLPEREGFS